MPDYLTGGYQTTINSTITELFPALVFNNKKKFKTADNMLDYVMGLADKEDLNTGRSGKSFVNSGDMESAYQFIEDTSKIRPKMLDEKVKNAIGIQDYLYTLNKERKIKQVVWGYRAKPAGIPGSHPGDIFIIFATGNPKILGVSLKAGTKSSAEPKMNSYVRTTLTKPMWKKADPKSEKRLADKLWDNVYSKLPGLDKTVTKSNWLDFSGKNQKPNPKVIAAVLRQFKKSPKKFDDSYKEMNITCRRHMIKMINDNQKAAKTWIKEEFRLELPPAPGEVPLVLVKAVGDTADEMGDKLAKVFPKITKIHARINSNSVQEWFIDVYYGKKKLTLLMTIRSDSEYRESKQKGKLGAYMGLKLLYRGYK